MNEIEKLKPTCIWRNFYALTQIPRPSGHVEKIQQYLLDFAKKVGVEAFQDPAGNIVMRKPATPGMENRKCITMQAHMDMVPQKTPESKQNLDPAEICEKAGGEFRVILGEFPEEEIGDMDLLVMSPGISCEMPLVEEFRKRRRPVWGEVELAYRTGRGKVLAVTGTNGKTTTVSLLGKILEDYYPEVYVVGNIGTAYTGVSMQQTDAAWTVAEISSFQLETIEEFHPAASAITNITEDHLNRHHTMEEYIRVKERIAENQTADEFCILNYEDPVLREFGEKMTAQPVWFSSARELEDGFFLKDGIIWFAENGEKSEFVRMDELQILGWHNGENVMTAAGVALYGAGIPLESIRRSVLAFEGVPHRIEYVGEFGGVRYYNDSKGTNPDAAIKAIQAMDRPTLLIGGGYDKESTYEEWIGHFDGKVRHFALIGQTREKIADAALRCGIPEETICFYDDLKEAVRGCVSLARPGDAVLLSPACASWGQFDNYEQRGDLFKEYVKELAAEA